MVLLRKINLQIHNLNYLVDRCIKVIQGKNMLAKYKHALALLFLWLSFLFTIFTGGIVPVAIGIFVCVYSIYLAFQQFGKNKTALFTTLSSLFLAVFLIFMPYEHIGFKHVNGEIVLLPHSHYLWESGHIH